MSYTAYESGRESHEQPVLVTHTREMTTMSLKDIVVE